MKIVNYSKVVLARETNISIPFILKSNKCTVRMTTKKGEPHRIYDQQEHQYLKMPIIRGKQ